MKTQYPFTGVLLFSALTLNAVAATPSQTVTEPQAAAATSKQAATVKFWTKDRIESAKPMIMIDTGDPSIATDDAAGFSPESTGTPGSTESGSPSPKSEAINRNAYPADWEALEDQDVSNLYISSEELLAATDGEFADAIAGTGSVYTYYDVNTNEALWKIYPHKWSGLFTFTTPSGNASCSATAISNNHILTAAHCVYDTPSRNKYYTNMAFHPAYRNGSKPYGTFAAAGCRVLTAWVNLSGSYSINSWARHDVAVCNAGKNSAGQTLNNAVGWAGRSWNLTYQQLHFNSGYPASNYNDASLPSPTAYLRACTAESFQQTTETLGSGCYYGRGISGGSWLRSYAPFKLQGQVNSVNSGLFIGAQNLYGARFNSNNIVTLCNAEGC